MSDVVKVTMEVRCLATLTCKMRALGVHKPALSFSISTNLKAPNDARRPDVESAAANPRH